MTGCHGYDEEKEELLKRKMWRCKIKKSDADAGSFFLISLAMCDVKACLVFLSRPRWVFWTSKVGHKSS